MQNPALNFKDISNLASQVEQGGDYDYAATLWDKAARSAKNRTNIAWCKARYNFLKHWAVRLREKKHAKAS